MGVGGRQEAGSAPRCPEPAAGHVEVRRVDHRQAEVGLVVGTDQRAVDEPDSGRQERCPQQKAIY